MSLVCEKNCCCNCSHQLKLMCHPWNKEFGKGSINEPCGYVCVVEFEDRSNKGTAIFSDKKHGMCELHLRKS